MQTSFHIATTAEEITMAKQLRHTVFVNEQGIPAALENDEDDERSIHLLVLNDQQHLVGTGRITMDGKTGIISRIAVDPACRNGGIGKKIITELEKIARDKKLKNLCLYPHAHLERFYNSLGYYRKQGGKTIPGFEVIFMDKDI